MNKMKKLFLRVFFVLMLCEGFVFCPALAEGAAGNGGGGWFPNGFQRQNYGTYRGSSLLNGDYKLPYRGANLGEHAESYVGQAAGAASNPASHQGGDGKSKLKGADYANMAVDVGLIVAGYVAGQAIHSWRELAGLLVPWVSIFVSMNLVESISNLAHAAVEGWMRKTTKIAAQFIGDEGHVTDRWVGDALGEGFPIGAMDAIQDVGMDFNGVAFDSDEYRDFGENLASKDARDLWRYRQDHSVEDQRTISNVADENWGIRYNSQRRAITALASALKLKSELSKLAEVDGRVNSSYGTLPSCWASVGGHRSVYDQLMLLKLNVIAARTKMRAEMIELDFKPDTEACSEQEPSGCDETGCRGLGGEFEWRNNSCAKKTQTCSAESCSQCDQVGCSSKSPACVWDTTTSACVSAAGDDDDGSNDVAQCSTTNLSACNNEVDCMALGSKGEYQFVSGQCQKVTGPDAGNDDGSNDIAQCSTTNLSACNNEADCTGLGSEYMYEPGTGTCMSIPTCSAANPNLCFDAGSCSALGDGYEWSGAGCVRKTENVGGEIENDRRDL